MAEPGTLALVYEPEAACRDRLIANDMKPERAAEVSSYLAQSTDIATEFGDIEAACARRGMRFLPVELDRLLEELPRLDKASTLIWSLTDGTAYFRGSSVPPLARLAGFNLFGSDEPAYALCQDKFRAGAVMRAHGMPCPPAGLCHDRLWVVEPPESRTGYFVKPNMLGAKIGIWSDSRCNDKAEAEQLSRRIYDAYGDAAIVQPYVAGRNVRASFLWLDQRSGYRAANKQTGVYFVDSGSDFQTMEDSLALYGEPGAAARSAGAHGAPMLEPVAATQPKADAEIRAILWTLVQNLGLGDVYSADFRVDADDTVLLLEFEVCPGLPCFDFRAYCRDQFGLSLADAMAEAAASRLFEDWAGWAK